MDARRVVTGHDSDGKAVFVSDERVSAVQPKLSPGSEFLRLWGGDEPPRFPDDGSMPPHTSYFPPVGGYRFGIFTVPPAGSQSFPEDFDLQAALEEFEQLLPGLAGHIEPDNPGMHTTATIDFEVVLSGEVTLELDDGAIVRLGAGDTVVQNGTRHRWANPGDVPAVLAVFIVGAHHERLT